MIIPLLISSLGIYPSTPSAGMCAALVASAATTPGDTDFDGLPDAWEMTYFGNLNQSGGGDPDDDGMTNLEEYQESTNPNTFNEVPGNLLINGQLQLDANNDGIPNNWTRTYSQDADVRAEEYLLWGPMSVGGRTSKMLSIEFTGTAEQRDRRNDGFFWMQLAPPGAQANPWEPDTWYEFSVWAAFDRMEPLTKPATVTVQGQDYDVDVLETKAGGLFAAAYLYPPTGTFYQNYPIFIGTLGPRMTGWDSEAWTYTDYQRPAGLEGWRKVRRYFKTPPGSIGGIARVAVATQSLTHGIGYFDNFVIRKALVDTDSNPATPPLNLDPLTPPVRRSGTLEFIQYKNQDFFPIFLGGFPSGVVAPGVPLPNGVTPPDLEDLAAVRDAGFNSALINNLASNLPGAMWAFSQPGIDLAMVPMLTAAFHALAGQEGAGKAWMLDPPAPYQGSAQVQQVVDFFDAVLADPTIAGLPPTFQFQNLLAFAGLDEIDSGIGSAEHGMFLRDLSASPQLTTAHAIRNYVHSVMPGTPVFSNFGSGPEPYNGVSEDKVRLHLPTADIVSFTANAPLAVPYVVGRNPDNTEYQAPAIPALPRVGEGIRRMSSLGEEQNLDVHFTAYALGTNCWAQWDGREIGNYGSHCDDYIPFNLQRFQIWDQIISGAVGVGFHGSYDLDISNPGAPTYNHELNYWEQMKVLAKELSLLYDVLIAPEFYAEWEVSNANVDIMMKQPPNGKVYLFAASRSLTDLPSVTIRLPGRMISSVSVLNEDPARLLCNGCRRTITPDGDNFTDSFVHQDPRDLPPLDPDIPGYAVHLYEIQAQRIVGLPPEATLLSARSRKFHTGRGNEDLPLNLSGPPSSEPRQGGISELRLTFDVSPGVPAAGGVTIAQRMCGDGGAFVPYAGSAVMNATVNGNELVLTFSPALENRRTYRFALGPSVTEVAGQSLTVRGLTGDAEGSGLVNAVDRSAVAGAWTSTSHYSMSTDLTRDGTTNALDRSTVVGAWGGCAP